MRNASLMLRILLAAVALTLAFEANAGWRFRFVQYRYPGSRHPNQPPPRTNDANRPKAADPAEKPVRFRDLALHSEFYFVADKERKLSPWIKVSATSARPIPTPANPNSALTQLPADMQVIVKKAEPKKQGDRKAEGTRKEQPANKDPRRN